MRKTSSVEGTKQLAASLVPHLRTGDTVILSGDLGAGKTHFVQGVAQSLGIQAPVTSPTFNILLSYEGGQLPLHHLDLYRLEDQDQLEDIGFYEVVEEDGVCFIEWGEKFPEALPLSYLEVSITVDEESLRKVKIHACGERARQLLFLWAQDSKSRLVKCN